MLGVFSGIQVNSCVFVVLFVGVVLVVVVVSQDVMFFIVVVV